MQRLRGHLPRGDIPIVLNFAEQFGRESSLSPSFRHPRGISLGIALQWREMPKRTAKGRTLYIKNPAAHRLAEQVSRRMGTTLSDAVIRALEAQVRQTAPPLDRPKIEAVCQGLASLPVRDSRTAEEILGYDAFGLPRP